MAKIIDSFRKVANLPKMFKKVNSNEKSIKKIGESVDQLKQNQSQILGYLHKMNSKLFPSDDPLTQNLGEGTDSDGKKELMLDHPKYQIKLITRSKMERKRASSCAKEPWTIQWIENYIKNDDVVYDIGANIGVYSLVIAKHTNHTAKIYSFEPSSFNFPSLCENIINNDTSNVITPIPLPLWDKTEIIKFNYRGIEAGNAKHNVTDFDSKVKRGQISQAVFGIKLDDIVDIYKLPIPKHIKLDVDGGELHVVRGGLNTLKNKHIKTVLIELEDSNRSEMTDMMKDCGFSLLEEYKREKLDRVLSFSYCLFIRNS